MAALDEGLEVEEEVSGTHPSGQPEGGLVQSAHHQHPEEEARNDGQNRDQKTMSKRPATQSKMKSLHSISKQAGRGSTWSGKPKGEYASHNRKKGTALSPSLQYYVMKSPVGKLLLAGNREGLRLISFQDGAHPMNPDPGWTYDEKPFREVINQLRTYFSGKRKTFSVKLTPEGTPFQRRVWQALNTIPHGKTVSYGDIAKAIGKPKASRAVGAANGKNPLSIIVPCHRVIGGTGNLVGYGGGLDIKKTLLSLEGWKTPTR